MGILNHWQLFLKPSINLKNVAISTQRHSVFIPRHTIVVGYYGFTLVDRVSVHPHVRPSVIRTSVRPYFRFRAITCVNINGFSPNLVCALILWRSGLGLQTGKLCQFLTELSARDASIFSNDNLRKYRWIFTKFGLCIDIGDFWFGIMGNFRQFLTEQSPRDPGYHRFTFSFIFFTGKSVWYLQDMYVFSRLWNEYSFL